MIVDQIRLDILGFKAVNGEDLQYEIHINDISIAILAVSDFPGGAKRVHASQLLYRSNKWNAVPVIKAVEQMGEKVVRDE
jgi:hypothetical protein